MKIKPELVQVLSKSIFPPLGQLWVEWDSGHVNIYKYNQLLGFDVLPVEEPRILKDELIAVGCLVQRGKDLFVIFHLSFSLFANECEFPFGTAAAVNIGSIQMYLWNIVGTMPTTVFVQSLSNYTTQTTNLATTQHLNGYPYIFSIYYYITVKLCLCATFLWPLRFGWLLVLSLQGGLFTFFKCILVITRLLQLVGRLSACKPVYPNQWGGCYYSNRPS